MENTPEEQAIKICDQIEHGGFGITSFTAFMAKEYGNCITLLNHLRNQIEYGDAIKKTFLGTEIDQQIINFFKENPQHISDEQ